MMIYQMNTFLLKSTVSITIYITVTINFINEMNLINGFQLITSKLIIYFYWYNIIKFKIFNKIA